MPSISQPDRLLLTGPFNGGQSDAARAEVCRRADAGARDVLYVVPNGTARRAVIADLVRRRSAVFGVRVVTVRDLPIEIERRARVASAPIAGGIIEDVLVERATRLAAGGSFPDVPMGGLASKVATTIGAVERSGGTRARVEAALREMPDAGDGARVMLDVWARLERGRDASVRTTATAFLSATELLRSQGAAALGGCSLVVLEDLQVNPGVEHDLLAALVAAADCPVVATSECAPQLDVAPATRALASLRQMASWRELPCTREADPFAGALDALFRAGATPLHETPSPTLRITRLEAAGDAGEVRLASRVVRRHLRDASCRPSDILIVAHGRGRYHELVSEIFGAAGIPVSIPRERTVVDTGLGALLLELLEVALRPDRATRDRSLELARAPQVDLGQRAADRLEQAVVTRGYLGMDGWDELAIRVLGERTTNRINRLKRAIAAARSGFERASSNADLALVVRQLAKDLRLVGNVFFARRRIVRAAGDDGLTRSIADGAVRADNQAWEVVEHVLDQTMPALLRMDGALAAKRGTALADGWLTLFRRALDAESPGAERPIADAVRVAGTRAGDGQPAKVTIVLGLLEKSFPKQHRQDPFLRDEVRRRLSSALGVDLRTSEDAAESERECFARVVATPSEALYLSYAATDEAGKPAVTSFFVEDLQRAVGEEHRFAVERLGVADVTPSVSDAATRSELLAAVSHDVWQRLPKTVAAEAQRADALAAWNALATRDAAVAPISRGRAHPTRPAFDRSLFAGTPHETLELSASQLGSAAHCTYKHFVQKVLTPEPIVAPGYDALTKGSLVHQAMMAWVGLDGWNRGEEALGELDAWIRAQAEAYPAAVRESALVRFQLEQDRDRVRAFLREELSRMAGGNFRPRFSELSFGARSLDHGTHDPASLLATLDLDVRTSAGERRVRLTGSVDRVDVIERDGKTLGVAVDYKTGKSAEHYAKAMLDGTDLQLRLYLLALERLWGIAPVGAIYVGLGDGVRRGAVRADVADRLGGFDPDCVRVMEPEEWNEFVHSDTLRLLEPIVDRLARLDIVAQPRDGDCGFCDLASLCRFDPYAKEAADA
jgi:hypothetical protein